METIFITISRGAIAKNILGTALYDRLRARYRVVVLTPAYEDERFLRTYGREGVTFLPLPAYEHTRLERVLFFFHKHLIYNSTVNQKVRWGIIGDPKSKQPTYLSYILRRMLFSSLSKIHALRDFLRFLDRTLTQKKEVHEFQEIIRREKPVCVIATNVSDDAEAALIKASQYMNVLTIGFPKSWDNLSKHGFRAKPTHLVVWNEFMKEQALEFHNYKPTDVVSVGVPQYDFNFIEDILMSREAFAELYGLDPQKKIVVFGSEGKLFQSDSAIAELIAEYALCGSPVPYQVLIRPHYGYKNDEKKFVSLLTCPSVRIDLFNNPSSAFRDAWDYSDEFTQRFVNTMYHADIVINTASTLTLDAVCFDTPVISIAFNGREELPYEKTVERWYETYYYDRILSYHATDVVRTKEELCVAIDTYLTDPSRKAEERARLKNDFTFRYDGRSAERFADFVSSSIEDHGKQ